jgi:hypothetical protein
MGIKVNINSYRQIAITITRKYLKKKKFIEDKKNKEGLENENEKKNLRQRDSVFDLQSGYDTHVTDMIYARAILETPGEMANIRQQYRLINKKWHRLLQFTSTFRREKRKKG